LPRQTPLPCLLFPYVFTQAEPVGGDERAPGRSAATWASGASTSGLFVDRTHRLGPYSHSIVLGGLELTSYTTRFTPLTSLIRRVEIVASSSFGNRAQSAVIPSRLVTARTAMTLS